MRRTFVARLHVTAPSEELRKCARGGMSKGPRVQPFVTWAVMSVLMASGCSSADFKFSLDCART